MKKILILIILSLIIVGCNKKEESRINEDAIKFKEEYESLNNDKLIVNINDSNPFMYKNVDDIKTMMDNKDTFLVFIGKEDDNYSRSLVETIIKSAQDNDLETVYYINNDYEKLNNIININMKIPIIFNVLNGKVDKVIDKFSNYNGGNKITDEEKKENYDLINPIVKDTIDTINTCNTEC